MLRGRSCDPALRADLLDLLGVIESPAERLVRLAEHQEARFDLGDGQLRAQPELVLLVELTQGELLEEQIRHA
jgi:hypothetical protein